MITFINSINHYENFHPPRVYYILFICLIAFSCKKTDFNIKQPQETIKLPATPQELQQVQINKDVASILEYVYQNPKAYYEVNAAIYSEYYADETVLLRDLLFPEKSPLYKMESFKKYKSPEGVFKKRFFEALSKGDYPVLKEAMGLNKPDNNLANRPSTAQARIEALAGAAPMDPALEIYSTSTGTSIYFPYSENFGSIFTTDYFDNINKDPWGNLATIVATDREANSAPGREPYPYYFGNDAYGEPLYRIRYKLVTTDDTYAEAQVTHIVGSGTSLMDNPPYLPPVLGYPSSRVFMGWVRLQGPQWDKFVSFSGNGGGSEIRIGRISGYLRLVNDQVTQFDGDLISLKVKRKEIRKKRWKRVYGVWDSDWKTGNTDQVLAVWEEDKNGEQTFTGSLSTTLRNAAGSNVTGSIGYTIKTRTEDLIVRQFKIDRYSYFRLAKADQGCGFQMCDDKGCRYDTDFLPAGQYWPIYDCGANFSWTWSYKTY